MLIVWAAFIKESFRFSLERFQFLCEIFSQQYLTANLLLVPSCICQICIPMNYIQNHLGIHVKAFWLLNGLSYFVFLFGFFRGSTALYQPNSSLWQLFDSNPELYYRVTDWSSVQTLWDFVRLCETLCAESLQSTWFSHGLLFRFSIRLLKTGSGFRLLFLWFKGKQAIIVFGPKKSLID